MRTSFARPMTNLFAYRYGGGATFSERYSTQKPALKQFEVGTRLVRVLKKVVRVRVVGIRYIMVRVRVLVPR